MKIRYTVTTIQKRCPFCGKVIETETIGDDTPLFIYLCVLAFPIMLPYLFIKHVALICPDFPKIGPKYLSCPQCSLLIRTGNYAVEDLRGKQLFLHKFKKWAYISYGLGAVFCFCILVIICGCSVFSLWGLFALLSLLSVSAIIIIYRIYAKKYGIMR